MAKNNSGGATATVPPPVQPAATDTPTDVTKPKRKRGGKRKRLLGEGDGDYCIYEIASVDSGLPQGSLIPIPNVPHFETTIKALAWLRNDSRDLLAGKQVMIFRAMEILSLRVETKAVVTFEAKPKRAVPTPEKAQA